MNRSTLDLRGLVDVEGNHLYTRRALCSQPHLENAWGLRGRDHVLCRTVYALRSYLT
jgi:hypothetical protein